MSEFHQVLARLVQQEGSKTTMQITSAAIERPWEEKQRAAKARKNLELRPGNCVDRAHARRRDDPRQMRRPALTAPRQLTVFSHLLED
jgi:hypothetical protein